MPTIILRTLRVLCIVLALANSLSAAVTTHENIQAEDENIQVEETSDREIGRAHV